MKVLQKESIIQREEVEHTMAEKEVLQSIYHPYIVNLKFAFQNKEKLFVPLRPSAAATAVLTPLSLCVPRCSSPLMQGALRRSSRHWARS